MSPRRLFALLALAVASYLLTIFLFHRFNPSSTWNFEIDRQTAIEKASAAATSLGYETAGAAIVVTSKYDRKLEYYLAKEKGAFAGQLLTPQKIQVTFTN